MSDFYMDLCPVCGTCCTSVQSCEQARDRKLLERRAPRGFLAALRQANTDRQREWDPDDAMSLSYKGNELAGEVGEACNIIKKLERETLGVRGSRATVNDLAEELADIIICVDLIAARFGLQLQPIVTDKFNRTSTKNKLKTLLVHKGA